MTSLLEARNLSWRIRGQAILSGVQVAIERGESVGIIGPNGSGKTTLFNLLSGFHRPDAGMILWDGRDVTNLSPEERAKLGLGRVFQNSGIFREMTVQENIVVALEQKVSWLRTFFTWLPTARALRREAIDFLHEVGLDAAAQKRASSLSGGQLRLLEIVRALAFGAEALLLDEPTAGVSPKMRDSVAHLLEKLRNEGKTIVVIEHDMSFIQQFCSRMVVMNAGQVALDGELGEVRRNPVLHEIYFGDGKAGGAAEGGHEVAGG